MALDFCCGAECQVTSVVAAPAVTHWNVIGGTTPTVSTVRALSGTYAYRMNTTAALSYWQKACNPTTGTTRTLRAAFYFDTLPDVSCDLLWFTPAAGGQPRLTFRQSDSTVIVGVGVNNSTNSVAIVTGRWYIFDLSADVGGAIRVVTGRVTDLTTGVTSFVGPVTIANAASTIANWRVGLVTAVTADCHVDDIATSPLIGDFPLPRSLAVAGCIPNRDGAHSFSASTDFEYNDVTGIAPAATDVYTYLDDAIDNITDFIAATGVAAGEYIEVGFTPMPSTTNVIGVEVVSGHHSETALLNKQSIRLNDGGTEVTVVDDADFSEITLVVSSIHEATGAAGAPWTKAKVDAVLARWGSSWTAVDITPIPYLDSIRLEVAYTTRVEASTPIMSKNLHAWL